MSDQNMPDCYGNHNPFKRLRRECELCTEEDECRRRTDAAVLIEPLADPTACALSEARKKIADLEETIHKQIGAIAQLQRFKWNDSALHEVETERDAARSERDEAVEKLRWARACIADLICHGDRHDHNTLGAVDVFLARITTDAAMPANSGLDGATPHNTATGCATRGEVDK